MERHITLPLTEELAQSLHAGDTVYLTGTIWPGASSCPLTPRMPPSTTSAPPLPSRGR